MIESHHYAVYLVDKAIDALGPVVRPFLKTDASGEHFIASEVDTGGAFCELTLNGQDSDGNPMTVEIMVPMGMIRFIMSVVSDEKFGFDVRRTMPSGPAA